MEIINLLNGEEFCPNLSIMKRLEEGIKTHSLIYTNKLRGIRKTYNLIEFAKKYRYTVVVSHSVVASSLRKTYNYENIYGQASSDLIGKRNLVIDEGVIFDNIILEENVITGFTNKKENIIPSLHDEIIKSLKNDIKSLLHKLEVTLNNNNDSNYKMLINNLRDTVDLMNGLEKRDIPQINKIYNMNCDWSKCNSGSVEEFLKRFMEK